MKNIKKTAVIAALAMIGWTFAACGDSQSGQATEQETETVTEQTEETTPQAAPAEEAAGEETSAADDIGVGPVTDVQLSETIDDDLAAKGEALFTGKGCTACHQMDAKLVGPPLKGVTQRRHPAWIMNMILNPDKMIQEDPTAKKLLEEYGSPMTNMGVTEDEARAILEYFRKTDAAS